MEIKMHKNSLLLGFVAITLLFAAFGFAPVNSVLAAGPGTDQFYPEQGVTCIGAQSGSWYHFANGGSQKRAVLNNVKKFSFTLSADEAAYLNEAFSMKPATRQGATNNVCRAHDNGTTQPPVEMSFDFVAGQELVLNTNSCGFTGEKKVNGNNKLLVTLTEEEAVALNTAKSAGQVALKAKIIELFGSSCRVDLTPSPTTTLTVAPTFTSTVSSDGSPVVPTFTSTPMAGDPTATTESSGLPTVAANTPVPPANTPVGVAGVATLKPTQVTGDNQGEYVCTQNVQGPKKVTYDWRKTTNSQWTKVDDESICVAKVGPKPSK